MKNYTYEEIKAMDTTARNEVEEACVAIMEENPSRQAFHEAYELYSLVVAVRDEEYREQNRDALHQFKVEHICGHTSEELELGNDVCGEIYNLYDALPEEKKTGYVFDKSLDDYYVSTYSAKHGMDTETVRKAYEFAMAWEHYSDFHKDVYGFRPKHIPA